MADPFVAEIRVVGFNFAPTGWATCDGQLLPISQNTALFSLLGTNSGGDGRATFALPNLQGMAVMGAGQGNGLTERWLGEEHGTESVTLQQSEIPFHTHTAMAATDPAEKLTPGPNQALARSAPGNAWQSNANSNLVALANEAVSPAGGSLPHNNRSPAVVMNFVIAMQGVFPSRP
jgi:microcystin-dependent protein